ncbi:RidA family protein [Paenibacillus sp. JSM ZJ436]|uniref:Endoribonuclease L-PSP n=1 Tax=Paenibacillus algicola TaxID=2565926 RepID=A0A4P8XGI5_9BACL|nr:RidA family protein [Paenibacillus algicola]QCT01233.1 endoribonuclease L-PSP [Paenibacillus algicola]
MKTKMKLDQKLKYAAAMALLFSLAGATVYAADKPAETPVIQAIKVSAGPGFYGSPSSSISSGVIVPQGYSTLYTSGTVPPLLNKEGKTVYERYGDTKTQGIGVLKAIEKQLQEQGLGMKDVVYLRVYITPDAAKDDAFDYKGWFDAYAEFFNTESNPVKPARSTVGVASLVSPDWLIEIEAVAVYPKVR